MVCAQPTWPQRSERPARAPPPGEPDRDDDEGPQHTVTIAKPLAAGKYEITSDEWDACVAGGGCARAADDGWGRGRRPVIRVSYEQAIGYTEWLSKKTGKPYRLLSEAEWEYAARAGSQAARFWGAMADRACEFENGADAALERQKPEGWKDEWGLHACDDGQARTAPVGAFKPNAFSACTTYLATSRNGSRTATTSPTRAPRRTVAPGRWPIVPGACSAAVIGATLRGGLARPTAMETRPRFTTWKGQRDRSGTHAAHRPYAQVSPKAPMASQARLAAYKHFLSFTFARADTI